MNTADFEKFLFSKYYRSLCFYAWKMVQDEVLAEDLAQDAFVSYFQVKKKVSDNELAIKSFLYSSVKYAVFNLNRKKNTIKKFWIRNPFSDCEDIDYEHELIKSEFMLSVNTALLTLPEACRTVMTMSFLEGFSNNEIANKLELSINTVKTQKQRGLRVLRTKLRPDYFFVFIFFL